MFIFSPQMYNYYLIYANNQVQYLKQQNKYPPYLFFFRIKMSTFAKKVGFIG